MPSVVRPIGHEDRISIVDHLDELRTRLIVCMVSFAVCFAFAYTQNDRVLDVMNAPLKETQNLDGNKKSNDPLEQTARFDVFLGEALDATSPALQGIKNSLEELRAQADLPAAQEKQLLRDAAAVGAAVEKIKKAASEVPRNTERLPVTLGVTEPFVTTFTVAGYAALLLALPLILYQLYAFLLPAFSPKERRMAVPFMVMVPILFLMGVAFGYFVALPRAVDFLQNFNDDEFDILLQASLYYKFSIVLLLVVGLLFQIPVAVLAITRLGILSPAQLSKNRGYIFLGVAVIAAVATPTPDPFTMLITMAPLIVLFELSLLLARVFAPKEGKPSRWDWDDDEEDEDDGGGDLEPWNAPSSPAPSGIDPVALDEDEEIDDEEEDDFGGPEAADVDDPSFKPGV